MRVNEEIHDSKVGKTWVLRGRGLALLGSLGQLVLSLIMCYKLPLNEEKGGELSSLLNSWVAFALKDSREGPTNNLKGKLALGGVKGVLDDLPSAVSAMGKLTSAVSIKCD